MAKQKSLKFVGLKRSGNKLQADIWYNAECNYFKLKKIIKKIKIIGGKILKIRWR